MTDCAAAETSRRPSCIPGRCRVRTRVHLAVQRADRHSSVPVGIGSLRVTTCRFSWRRSPRGPASSSRVFRRSPIPAISSSYPPHFFFARIVALLDRLHRVGVRDGRACSFTRTCIASRARAQRPHLPGSRTAMSEAMVERVPAPRYAALFCLAAADPAGDRGGARRASPDVDRRRRFCRCVRVSVGPSAAGDLHDVLQRAVRARRRAGGARANSHIPLSCRHVHLRRSARVDQGHPACRSQHGDGAAGSELQPVRRSCELRRRRCCRSSSRRSCTRGARHRPMSACRRSDSRSWVRRCSGRTGVWRSGSASPRLPC